MDAAVTAAYRRCARFTRREARNFVFAIATLPRVQRWAVEAVYVFCREADDIADGTGSLDEKAAGLAALGRRLDAAAAGTPAQRDLALADAIVRYGIDPHDLHEVVEGVRMDLSIRRYAAFSELVLYCHRVASAVGLSVLPILASGRGGQATDLRDRGEALGLGMQLANIVRDVAEDLDRDRIYLPIEDLSRFGVTEDALRARRVTGPIRELLAFETARARATLRDGERVVAILPRRARAFPLLLSRIYGAVLDRIEASGYDVFSGRAALSTREKLGLTVCTVLAALLR
jgi:15-cis-phytoene synthase